MEHLKINLLQRKPAAGQFSIEGYFVRVVEEFGNMGIPARLLIAPVLSRGLFRRLRILLFAMRNQGDVTHITGDISFAALATTPAKTVVTILDCEVIERSRGLKKALIRYLWFTLPVTRAAAVTVISDETKRQLLRQVPTLGPEKIYVIPVSISDRFTPSPRRKFSKKPVILQIGTKKNKNLPRLIEALKGVPCFLSIVGNISDEIKETLAQHAIDYEVHFDLSDDELLEIYRAANILTFVSTYEGFGMPIVEAQSIGLPVVASNCSSMPEVAGNGACLVDPFEVSSIRAGIQKIIDDEAYQLELIDRGFENAKRFSSNSIARQYADVYSASLKARRK